MDDYVVNILKEEFAYITDCSLATVSSMAMRKSRSKGEYLRQIDIAQRMVNTCKSHNIDIAHTRAETVIGDNLFKGSVAKWAASYEEEKL